MKGYIIQTDTDQFVNWQGLLVNEIKNSALFSTEADAIIVRDYSHPTAAVIPHERNDAAHGQLGTYHEYHRNT